FGRASRLVVGRRVARLHGFLAPLVNELVLRRLVALVGVLRVVGLRGLLLGAVAIAVVGHAASFPSGAFVAAPAASATGCLPFTLPAVRDGRHGNLPRARCMPQSRRRPPCPAAAPSTLKLGINGSGSVGIPS